MKEITVTIWRETEDSELEIEVTADYSPGADAQMPGPRDDVGSPPEPPEIEITSAVDQDGNDIELDEVETERALEKIQEAADDQ